MKIDHFARKKRQLKTLCEELSSTTINNEIKSDTPRKDLVKKVRQLLVEMVGVIPKRELIKALGVLAIFFGFQSTNNLNAQTFVGPSVNVFNIASGVTYLIPALADMDGDGDLDMMTGDYSDDFGTSFFRYYENIGTPTSPDFAPPIADPFGLTQLFYITLPTLADVDGDGDFDFIVGSDGEVPLLVFENIGTASAPEFGPAENAVTAINFPANQMLIDPDFVDIDNDGDLDLMGGTVIYNMYFDGGAILFYENTGSATNPQFSNAVINQYGFDSNGEEAIIFPTSADCDNDGDLDLIAGTYYGNLTYYENIGTAEVPQYGAPQVNALGLQTTNDFSFPALGDFDNDGDQDLIVGEYYGNSNYYENVLVDGISELYKGDHIKVFPNPTNDVVNIQADLRITSVTVYDALGKQCESALIDNKTVDLHILSPGMYNLHILLKDGTSLMKKISKY